MTTAPVLQLPDFSKESVIQTDASGIGMGTILTQNGHPVSFFSKSFCSKLQNSSTYVRELHAITTAVHKWRHYLFRKPIYHRNGQKMFKETHEPSCTDSGLALLLDKITRVWLYNLL